LQGLTKSYGDVVANAGINLQIWPGMFHCVLGENGAGKSTLMQCIFGAHHPDSGDLLWHGRVERLTTPKYARELGIGMVFQHFALVDDLSIGENLELYLGKKRFRELLKQSNELLPPALALPNDLARTAESLSAGEKQRLEIARVLLDEPQLLILDEPTSVLTQYESEELLHCLKQMTQRGLAVVLITHKLEEALAWSDRISILSRGKVVTSGDTNTFDRATLAELMLGDLAVPTQPSAEARITQPERGPPVLELRGVSMAGVASHHLHDVDLQLAPGEILGITGIAGNGQDDFTDILLGVAEPTTGDVYCDPAITLQITPLHRDSKGCVPAFSLLDQILITNTANFVQHGLIRKRELADACRQIIEDMEVLPNDHLAAASTLSGGNLQKFLIGRALAADPAVLVCNNPTWGVDLRATHAIHDALRSARQRGCAVLLLSQDVEEVLALSDRISVLCEGRLSEPRPTDEMPASVIGRWMSDPTFSISST